MTEIVDSTAETLLRARDNRSLVRGPGHSHSSFDLDQGYAVYSKLDAFLRGQGYQPAGRKIGFTNPATWEEFGLETPIWAYIYDRTVLFTESSATSQLVSISNLVQPRIETELVLQVNENIRHVPREPAALVQALDWLAIGFEIVQCHYPDWQFSAAEAVADFCLHNELIVGPRQPIATQDLKGLSQQIESFQVELSRGQETIAQGSGEKVLGSPLRALAFLLQVLDSQDAPPLQAGEVITTGTMTPILPIQPGQVWSARVYGLDLEGLSIQTGE